MKKVKPKIAIVVGTRPEIIKMSPIIRECERLQLDYFILHTGQHYSYNMDRIFFEQLELPEAKHNLDVGSGTHAEQTGKILIGCAAFLPIPCIQKAGPPCVKKPLWRSVSACLYRWASG